MATKFLSKTNGFSSALNDMFEPWNEWFQNGFGKALTVPAANIEETDSAYSLSLAAPGMKKEDFKIEVNNHLLTISSEQEKTSDEKNKNFTRHEYNYSSFSRCFTLPEEVSEEKIDASYKDGVLKIAIPKTEKATKVKTKMIAVK